MPQDQQQQPESTNSEPQRPPTPNQVGQTGTGLKKISKSTQRTGNQGQPFLKAQSINVLRGTIGLLEGIVEKLEAEPVRERPAATPPPITTSVSAPVLDTATATPERESASTVSEAALEAPGSDTPAITPQPALEVPTSSTPAVTAQPAAQKPIVEPTPPPAKPKLTDRLLPSFRTVQGFWDSTLQKVRSLLPAAWNEKLSDWALTGAIAGIVVVLLVATATLLPDTPAQVAKAPPNTINTPPELKAPKEPQPVDVEPPPAPELTPEQSLIAAIQEQVAEVTDRYGNGLIQSIEANFQKSHLSVKVGNGWYDLKPTQQNNLADEILRRSVELDFSKLEITDLKGTLLARSPVVGSNMVILKRQELVANL
jgi:hypothetical protein